MKTIHLQHHRPTVTTQPLQPGPRLTDLPELHCRHLAVSYTAFCTDCQQWLDEGISDLLGLFLLGARS